MSEKTACIVGSGPNGLAAALTLARAGWSVSVYEAKDRIGGGTRTLPLLQSGCLHDVCSAIHPLGLSSPFFSGLPEDGFDVNWIHPEIPLAHPLDDGTAVILARSMDETGAWLDRGDDRRWKSMMGPLVDQWQALVPDVLAPLRLPKSPLLLARFGIEAMQPASTLVRRRFRGERSKALFAGIAAHSIMPLDKPFTSAFGLLLGAAGHAVGWPLVRGGSRKITDALAEQLKQLGGEVVLHRVVETLDELPASDAILFDLTPRQVVSIAGHVLPERYLRALRRFRYGCGTYKMDWILREPVPWTAEACRRAGTVHVGGTFDEIARAEQAAWEGHPTETPFVLVAQQSLFDDSRAPEGLHTLWGYCHVPHNADTDMSLYVENQIERYAPGFKEVIVDKHTMTAPAMQAYNSNYIGGDIQGGIPDWKQLFTRPIPRLNPYATPDPRLFICSSSTPPGGGVHGMCGYHAAKTVLARHSA